MPILKTRPATQADIEEWYEGEVPSTSKAWVVTLDGKVAGIAGLSLGGLAKERKFPEAFCDMAPELAPHIRHPIVQWAISRVVRMIRQSRVTVTAIADPDLETSEPLLRRLGAVPIGRSPYGEVYQWIR